MATIVFSTPAADPAVFTSQAARDAAAMGYGGESYWNYLDGAAQESHDLYMARGDEAKAELMLTRSLGEALAGNDGD